MLPVSRLTAKAQASVLCSLRYVTGSHRALPTAVIVGAQKAGTSSLFSYLTQHPMIAGSFRKEVHYFDGGLVESRDSYSKGLRWYRSHFPLVRNLPIGAHVIEATPSYLFLPGVAERIQSALPDVRIIIVLRHPVERTISHYFHEVKAGRERRSIENALAGDEPMLSKPIGLVDKLHLAAMQKSYKGRSVYWPQVKDYLRVFSRDRVLVISSKNLFLDPKSTVAEILAFLELGENLFGFNEKPNNVNAEKGRVPDGVFDFLDEYFQGPNEKLFDLLGTAIEW